MKIYFAGVAGIVKREKMWFKVGLLNRLISYFTHITNNQLNKDTQVIFNQILKEKTNGTKKTDK